MKNKIKPSPKKNTKQKNLPTKGSSKSNKQKTENEIPITDEKLPCPYHNNYSQEVSRLIINKIISNVITKSTSTKAYNSINKFVCDFLKKRVESIIQMEFIPFDKDESQTKDNVKIGGVDMKFDTFTPREETDNISQIFEKMEEKENITHSLTLDNLMLFDCYKDGDNFWGDIPSPLPPTKDSYASTQIAQQYYNQFDERESFVDKTFRETKKSFKKSNKSRLSSMGVSSPLYQTPKKEPTEKKVNLAQIMSNMSYYDMDPKEFVHPPEIPEAHELRLQELKKEEIRIEREKENTKYEAEQHKTKEKNNQLKAKTKNNNFTIDSTGEIVIMRKYPVECLEKDFIYADVKISKNKEKELVKIDKKGKKKFKFKEKEEEPPTPEVKKEDIIFNKDKFAAISITPEPIIPSGSNFNLLTPECGVTILEEAQSKTGGKDFFKKFKKFSDEKYNQTFKDFYNSSLGKTAKNTQGKIMFKEMSNTSLGGSNYFQNSSTLRNDMDYIDGKNFTAYEESYNKNFPLINNHTLNIYGFKNSFYDKMSLTKSNSSGNFMLNNNSKYSNIKNAIENSDVLQEDSLLNSDYNNTQKPNNTSLFLHNFSKTNESKLFQKKLLDEKKLNEINNFTKQLMNGTFANINFSKNAFPKIFNKPRLGIGSLQKEMEYSVRNTKFPRERMKVIAQDVLGLKSPLNNSKKANTTTNKKVKGMMKSASQKVIEKGQI